MSVYTLGSEELEESSAGSFSGNLSNLFCSAIASNFCLNSSGFDLVDPIKCWSNMKNKNFENENLKLNV